MRPPLLLTLAVLSVPLAGCSTWKPPEISYDDTPRQAFWQR